MKAPIALFVYNRPEHTRKTMEALINNYGVKDYELFVFSDGAKDEIEENNVNLVRQYLNEIVAGSYFKKVHLAFAQSNRGLEASIIDGVAKVINKYGRIIVLEDDIVTSPDFLMFMNSALDAYESDLNIWSISSYSLNNKKISKCQEDVLWTYRGECWGWASWVDRWNKVDWLVSDYEVFKQDKKRQRLFNRGGRDMTSLLEKQQAGEVKSWAIRWCYQQFKEQMITIFPKHTKCINIGFDGSGTNCSNEGNRLIAFKEETQWDFHYNIQNKLLLKEYQKDYRKQYWRQTLGKYWYLLTEYEYCLIYRNLSKKDKIQTKILKPSFKEWYADPIPFLWKGKTYVFVEMYDKLKGKGCIGVSEYTADGYLKGPQRIIEENFHMSFPNVFQMGTNVYMIPECCEINQIRIYQMGESITEWQLIHAFENQGKIVDIAVWEDGKSLILLGSRINEENPNQSRLVEYRLINLENKSATLDKCWEAEEYKYDTRNGGNFIKINGETYRIVQHSTKEVYGKFITLKKVSKLDASGIVEIHSKKMDINSQGVELPPFIYRLWGIHTYGVTEQIEIMDLLVQRFSLGGLFMKIYRGLKR